MGFLGFLICAMQGLFNASCINIILSLLKPSKINLVDWMDIRQFLLFE